MSSVRGRGGKGALMEWLTDCGDDGTWTETSDEQRLAGSGSPWMVMFGHVVAPGRDGGCVARRGDAPGGDDFTRRASETTKWCGGRRCSGARAAALWRGTAQAMAGHAGSASSFYRGRGAAWPWCACQGRGLAVPTGTPVSSSGIVRDG
jgi:hypothetical protein